MPFPKRVFTPEQIAEARYLYEQTVVPVREIAAMLGVHRDTLRLRARALGWNKRDPNGRSFSPEYLLHRKIEAANDKMPEPDATPNNSALADRVALAARLQRMAERQMDLIEIIMAKMGEGETDKTERAARTVALLHRTLQMLRQDLPPAQAESADDDMPRDLDELRRALCEKLERIVAGTTGDVPGDA